MVAEAMDGSGWTGGDWALATIALVSLVLVVWVFVVVFGTQDAPRQRLRLHLSERPLDGGPR